MGVPNIGDAWDELNAVLIRQADTLDAIGNALERHEQQHSRQLREWERFVLSDGGVCTAGGALTVGGDGSALRPAPNGWEAYVTSIAVTVSGASAAATITNYNGPLSDLNLFDYANSMLGNSPSRMVAFYDAETVYVEQGDTLSIVLAGAAANANVIVRVAGQRRQT